MPDFNKTIEWIDEKKFLLSPLKFSPIPYVISDFPGVQIEYVRRDARIMWDKYARKHVEEWLLIFERILNTYAPIRVPYLKEYVEIFIDRNTTDTTSYKLHVKPDR